jgi:hypothetical protein
VPSSEVMGEDVELRDARVNHPRCPYCHDVVRPQDAAKVGCSACMAWHHEACWGEAGGCGACGFGRAAPRPATIDEAKVDAEPAVRDPPVGLLLGAALAATLLVGAGAYAYLRPAQVDWRAGLNAAVSEEERTAWARRGAESGDAGAMNLLGFRLLTGAGCERDPVEALRWGERAAEAGHAEAMYGIAMLYETGEAGVRDEEAAARWYRRAVAAGDTLAGPRLDALLRRRPDLR